MTKQKKYFGFLLGLLLSSCGGPDIETVKEPVLGTEKHKLTGYRFANREKTVNSELILSCSPTSKNKNVLNGTLYLGSLSNEYTFDDKVLLFLEVNGTRHTLNIISRSQSTGEVGKNFFKSTRVYVTSKSLSFDLDANLLNSINSSTSVKLVLAREIGTIAKETVDILVLHPDEFESKHYSTIDEFAQKCSLRTKI
jgi:hypothetical protein